MTTNRNNKIWKYFGTDGARGVIGENFDAGLVYQTASAIANVVQPSKVVIGCDTRASCDFIVHVLGGALASGGTQIINVGVVPTAGLSYLTSDLKADLGIMISASHNDFTYNGIKLFAPSGEKLCEEIVGNIDAQISRKLKIETVSANKIGRIIHMHDAINRWQDYLVEIFAPFFKAGTRKRIAVDCAFGSGAECAQAVFAKLGFDAVLFNTKADGYNINHKCGATAPEFLRAAMKKDGGFDAGFSLDGDADRCVVSCGNGEPVHGDALIYLLAKYLQDRKQLNSNKIVSTIMFNLGIEKKLGELGIEVIRTAVGDRFVYRVLSEQRLSFGGETSGHIILPAVWRSGDGLAAALMTLAMLEGASESLQELCKELKPYPQVNKSVKVTAKQKTEIPRNKDFKSFLKLTEREHKDCKILVRPSGTENIIRVTVEGQDFDKCENIVKKINAKIDSIFSTRIVIKY